MHIWLFDDLVADDAVFITDVFDAVGVGSGYVPAPVDNTSNKARTAAPDTYQTAVKWMRKNVPDEINSKTSPIWEQFRWLIEDRSLYEEGIKPETRAGLERIYADDIRAPATYLDRDLDHWFEHVEL